MTLSPEQRVVLLDAARDAIRRVLRQSVAPWEVPMTVSPSRAVAHPSEPLLSGAPGPDPVLQQPAGVFVSLHRRGAAHQLRGCVGRLDASRPLLQAVVHAAETVLRDPRFKNDPVRWDELPELEIEISVLSPLRLADDVLNFDLQNEGVYLRIGDRTGCFLPQVARETGWTREQLLDRLCTEKMGLPPNAWRQNDAQLQIFSSVLLGPEPF